jgi:hypothetical protein
MAMRSSVSLMRVRNAVAAVGEAIVLIEHRHRAEDVGVCPRAVERGVGCAADRFGIEQMLDASVEGAPGVGAFAAGFDQRHDAQRAAGIAKRFERGDGAAIDFAGPARFERTPRAVCVLMVDEKIHAASVRRAAALRQSAGVWSSCARALQPNCESPLRSRLASGKLHSIALTASGEAEQIAYLLKLAISRHRITPFRHHDLIACIEAAHNLGACRCPGRS